MTIKAYDSLLPAHQLASEDDEPPQAHVWSWRAEAVVASDGEFILAWPRAVVTDPELVETRECLRRHTW